METEPVEFKVNQGIMESLSSQSADSEPTPPDPEVLSSLQKTTSYSFMTIFPSNEAAIKVAASFGLIPSREKSSPPLCPKCQSRMTCNKSKDNQAGFVYRCRKMISDPQLYTDDGKRRRLSKICRGYVSPLSNTFFSNVNAPVLKIFRLIHAWAIHTPVTTAYEECEISRKTAIEFYSFCREVAAVVVSHMQTQIGGPGLTVEVDETFARRRKRNRGQLTSQTLVILGIYCRETKEGLYWQVPEKSRRVLWSYMLKYIAAGSTIMTDCAPQYRGCEKLGFSFHKTVKHSKAGSRRCVDTKDTNIHIRNIETRNKHLKNSIKRLSTDKDLLLYISEFTYRERVLKHAETNGKKFARFLEDVKRVYPGPGREGLQMQQVGIAPDDALAGTYLDFGSHEDMADADLDISGSSESERHDNADCVTENGRM